MRNKIHDRKILAKILTADRQNGKTIVSTNGCFDLLHVGHLRYLEVAKELGDLLVVCLNSDRSVKKLKGKKRPIISENDRAELLAGLEVVDYVTIFTEETPIEILSLLKPDIHVKGGDYAVEELIEREVVEANGGKVVVGLYVEGKSTSELIDALVACHVD